jgi:cytosine deaminase
MAGDGFDLCMDLVTTLPARLMNLKDYGLAVGHPADLVVLDAPNAASALAELAEPLMGFKGGRQTFSRPPGALVGPSRREQPR